MERLYGIYNKFYETLTESFQYESWSIRYTKYMYIPSDIQFKAQQRRLIASCGFRGLRWFPKGTNELVKEKLVVIRDFSG